MNDSLRVLVLHQPFQGGPGWARQAGDTQGARPGVVADWGIRRAGAMVAILLALRER